MHRATEVEMCEGVCEGSGCWSMSAGTHRTARPGPACAGSNRLRVAGRIQQLNQQVSFNGSIAFNSIQWTRTQPKIGVMEEASSRFDLQL